MFANRAFIGIGSNLGDSRRIINSAIDELGQTKGLRVLKASSMYRSKPLLSKAQPDYINAVAQVLTVMDADQLLDVLQQIESDHGRVRGDERWASRTLDLDLLLYNDSVIMTDRLVVPHPGITEREFVLYPLCEIAPDIMIPGVGPLSNVLVKCPSQGLEMA